MKAKVIAFYLPQYYPTEENNKWWGEGYTEWTNVGKAKPLFRGHKQPRVPADLGYYDLRLKEVREKQANLAKEAGISAFCYWHYWLGGGKRLLTLPLQEVLSCKEPDFPFCLGWANHSWYKKEWNPDVKMINNTLLMEQKYLGKDDIICHFNTMLDAFKDYRYYKISGRNVFYIYDIRKIPNFAEFKSIWNQLANKNGLKDFFFISCASGVKELEHPNHALCDGVNVTFLTELFGGRKSLLLYFKEKLGTLFDVSLLRKSYEKSITEMVNPIFKEKRIYPTIIPNWDNSPRRKGGATILTGSTPHLFGKLCNQVFDLIKEKDDEDKIVFLKSWNEWAEGNYMEPDIEWGKQYIQELRKALD